MINRKKRLSKLGKMSIVFSATFGLIMGIGVVPANSAVTPITFVTPAYLPGTVKAFDDAVSDWNKANPNTPVKLIPGDWGNLGDQLTTQFAAGTAPDVIHFASVDILNFAARGYLHDLSSSFRAIKKNVSDGGWQASSYKGKLYGVPVIDQPYVVFVNLDLFKKAGIAVPTTSLNWDELAALAKRLTTSTTYGLATGLVRPATVSTIVGSNFGAKFFVGYTSGRAKIQISSAELEFPTRMHKMVYEDKSIDPLMLTVSAGGSLTNFIAGKSAMLFMGSYAAADLDIAARDKGFNWSVMPILKGSAGSLQAAGPQTFSISAQSKVKKDAARFINFMMQDKYLVPIALGDGLVPMTKTAMKGAVEAKKGSPGWQQIFADGDNFVVPNFTYVPEFNKWKTSVLQSALQRFMQNRITRSELQKSIVEGWATLR